MPYDWDFLKKQESQAKRKTEIQKVEVLIKRLAKNHVQLHAVTCSHV